VNAVETLKQELLSYNDYSSLEIFRAIDQYAHGNINCDNLRCFFLNFPFCSALSESDLKNWIRRYDRDVDGKLDYADFVRALGPYCNYSQKAQLIGTDDEPGSQLKKPSPVEPIQGYDLIDAAKSEQQMPAYEKAGSIAGRSGYTKSTAISYRRDGVAVSEALPRTKKFISPSRVGAVSKATQPIGKFGKGAKDMII
jgi:hypothetical protein